jgi:hypothetical protein
MPCPCQGPVNYADPDWANRVYTTAFKEPFYKGGRVKERVPSWTDRIQYHSLAGKRVCVQGACTASSPVPVFATADRSGELAPELLDPSSPETSPHNYRAVNDGLDGSDHSPVYATFVLQVGGSNL